MENRIPVLPYLSDERVRDIFLEASAKGFLVHEEKRSQWRMTIATGETGAAQHSRFTCILPDTRLISSVAYEPRCMALIRIAVAIEKYLPQFEVNRRLK